LVRARRNHEIRGPNGPDRNNPPPEHISHGVVMAIQTVEARIHGVHRDFTDVVVFIVIGSVLFALLPTKREAVASGVA